MTVFIKVLIFMVLVIGTILLNIKLSFIEKYELPEISIAVLFFLFYISLVIAEVRLHLKRGEDYGRIKRAGFMLSFWIGIIWGVMMSFSAGFHFKITPLILIGMLTGYVLFGLLFGFMGQGIVRLYWSTLMKAKR